MVLTRGQAAKAARDGTEMEERKPHAKDKPLLNGPKTGQTNAAKKRPSPRDAEKTAAELPPAKRGRSSQAPSTKSKPHAKIASAKVEKLIQEYGQLPLSDVGLSSPHTYSSETVLAHILNAILSSARISHAIAAETLRCLIKANYHDLGALKKSTWEERTDILTQGGYTHYREKTATALGELAEMLDEKYSGNVLYFVQVAQGKGDARKAQRELAARLKEVKGLGPLGVDIFFGAAQSVIPQIAPFISHRDIKILSEIGLHTDLDKLFHEVGDDATNMAKLSAALTKIRLDKHVSEFA